MCLKWPIYGHWSCCLDVMVWRNGKIPCQMSAMSNRLNQSGCMFSHCSRARIHISNAQFFCILQVMRKKTLEELGCVAQLRREIEIQSHLKWVYVKFRISQHFLLCWRGCNRYSIFRYFCWSSRIYPTHVKLPNALVVVCVAFDHRLNNNK